MEQKTKFIITGLIGFSIICLFLFMQATSSKQMLIRERNDLKTENTVLLSKINQLENDLKGNQGKIDSLKAERDKVLAEMNDLQKKFELASKARGELVEKLKSQQSQRQETVNTQQELIPQNTDAYWGEILKAKTDLEMQLSGVLVQLKDLQISNESLQREKNVLEIDINSLRNEKKDLLRQLDYNQKVLDSISQEVVREKNDKLRIQESFKAIKNENALLDRQLKSLSSRRVTLDKKIQDLQEGKSTVEKRLSEMEMMFADKASQISSLKDELDTIRSGKPLAALEGKSKESVELPAIVVHSSKQAGRENAGVIAFSGKLLAVNTDNNFVVIDLGASSGLKPGDTFNVYRAGKTIGSIEVIQVRDNISACDIKGMNTPLKIGDNIK